MGEINLAVRAWNAMGGQIEWTAVPLFVELYGVVDVDVFVAELVAIRQHFQLRQQANG